MFPTLPCQWVDQNPRSCKSEGEREGDCVWQLGPKTADTLAIQQANVEMDNNNRA